VKTYKGYTAALIRCGRAWSQIRNGIKSCTDVRKWHTKLAISYIHDYYEHCLAIPLYSARQTRYTDSGFSDRCVISIRPSHG